MIDTKQRILEASLELFNREGTETITVRHIAKELGISHGNLCYHFPTTDDIVATLYYNLADELDILIKGMQEKGQGALVGQGGKSILTLLYKYRFLMLNFVEVMRRLPDVKKHYQKLQERRKLEFHQVFENMVEAGLMRKELYPGFFDDMITNMTIIGDSWIQHAEILYKGKEKEKIDFYYRVANSLITPMLTEKGLEAFAQRP